MARYENCGLLFGNGNRTATMDDKLGSGAASCAFWSCHFSGRVDIECLPVLERSKIGETFA